MKKLIAFVLMLSMLLGMSAFAEGMGVQVIGGSQMETEPVSLDDMQLNAAADIEGWGSITLTACKYVDLLHQYKQGKHTVENNWNRFSSGVEAEYLLIQADILNITKASRDYMSDVEVKVVFNDDVEYAGWAWQYNWDNETKNRDWNELNDIQNKEFVIDKADQFAIGPYYTGHYCFGCTLPNAVVEGKYPLRIEITIDGNELTYHIRK